MYGFYRNCGTGIGIRSVRWEPGKEGEGVKWLWSPHTIREHATISTFPPVGTQQVRLIISRNSWMHPCPPCNIVSIKDSIWDIREQRNSRRKRGRGVPLLPPSRSRQETAPRGRGQSGSDGSKEAAETQHARPPRPATEPEHRVGYRGLPWQCNSSCVS